MPQPVRDVLVALMLLPHLPDPSPKLTAGAWPTTGEMPRSALRDVLLVTTVAQVLLKRQQVQLPLGVAHALPTRTEMVLHAQTAPPTPPRPQVELLAQ